MSSQYSSILNMTRLPMKSHRQSNKNCLVTWQWVQSTRTTLWSLVVDREVWPLLGFSCRNRFPVQMFLQVDQLQQVSNVKFLQLINQVPFAQNDAFSANECTGMSDYEILKSVTSPLWPSITLSECILEECSQRQTRSFTFLHK